jgi:inosine-uridine nucleoside N-ribohydrolase
MPAPARLGRVLPWLAAALACAPLPVGAKPSAPAPAKVSIYFDNDFLGPGQSNIQALIPLLRDARVDLVGIGVVTGDAWLQEETAHTLRFLEIARRGDVPVLAGAEMPLLRTQREMRDWETRYGAIPWKGAWNAAKPGRNYHPDAPSVVPPLVEGAPSLKAAREDAVAFLIRQVRAHPHQITVVTAGPLTNIALAVRIAPDLPALAKEIVIEGGGVDNALARVSGNTDYATDFNFLFDPEAAHIVLTAAWPKVTVLGNVTGSVKVTPELATRIGKAGTPVARYFDTYARRGQPMWDEIVSAVAVDRTLVTDEIVVRMDVDLLPGPAYGQAQIWNEQFAPKAGEREVHLVRAIDTARFLATFVTQASR